MFSVPPPPPPNREYVDAKQRGVVGDGVRDDTVALQAAIDRAIANNLELFLPAGNYKISSGLVWNDPTPRIRGEGYRTQIHTTNSTFTALTVGTGATGGLQVPAGWVSDFHIQCDALIESPAGNTSGLKVDGALFTDIRNISVGHFPIGFDITNGGYGCLYTNIRTWDRECRISMLLRGEIAETSFIGAGSDITIINPWLHGGECAIWLEGNQGNYHVVGGQLSARMGGTPSDDHGVIIMGKSYTTGLPMGSCGLTLRSTSFERIHNGWGIRGFGNGTSPSGLSVICDAKTSFMGGTGAIGIWKITNGWNDRVEMSYCNVGPDTFSSAEPCVYSSPGVPGAARPLFTEVGTVGIATFGGVSRDLNDRSLLHYSPTVPYIRSQSWAFDFNTGRNVFWTPEGLVATDERGQVVFDDSFTIS